MALSISDLNVGSNIIYTMQNLQHEQPLEGLKHVKWWGLQNLSNNNLELMNLETESGLKASIAKVEDKFKKLEARRDADLALLKKFPEKATVEKVKALQA